MLLKYFRNMTRLQAVAYAVVVANLIVAALMMSRNPYYFVAALLLAIVFPWEVYRRNRRNAPGPK